MDQPKYRIEIFWSDEDDGYIANVPALRYCSAFGESYEEALREVLVAMELYLDTMQELDRPIPKPGARRGVGVSAFVLESGQIVELEEVEGSDRIRVNLADVEAATPQGVGRAVEPRKVLQSYVNRMGLTDPVTGLSRKFLKNWVETLDDLESNPRRMQNLEEELEEMQQAVQALREAAQAAKREAER